MYRLKTGVEEERIPRILVDTSRCSGCRRCELQCSFSHEGKYWPEMSRVKVEKDEISGVDSPRVCRQCVRASCVEACGAKALSRDPMTDAVLLDKERCQRCLACVAACPFGAIHSYTCGFPLLCDLCGGDPACVKACPTAAIWFGRPGGAPPAPRFAQPGKERPSQEPGGGQR